MKKLRLFTIILKINTYQKKIKKKQKRIVLLYGDYSRTSQMKETIPSCNVGFKRVLQKRVDIIEINEYNTSKLYNKTFKELQNILVRRKKHDILTPKDDN